MYYIPLRLLRKYYLIGDNASTWRETRVRSNADPWYGFLCMSCAFRVTHILWAPFFPQLYSWAPKDRSGHYCREETWPKPLGWFASLFAFSSLEDLPTRLRLKPSYSSSGKNTTTKEYYTFSLQELPAQFGQWQGPNVLSTVNQEKQEPLYVRRLLWRRCWLEDRLCICRKIDPSSREAQPEKKEKYNPNMTMKKYHGSPNWHLNYKSTGQYASFEVTKYKNRLRNYSNLRRPRDLIVRCNTWSGIGLWTTERSFVGKLSNFCERLGLNLLKHVHYHSFKYRLRLPLPSGKDE